ncbi:MULTISPECIES: M23 family metallopeptidase [Butyricimonas]|uniref:M23 family metallopeptidase n=1 Tax=Butyricimonas TaxID=574697 RepID=UPI001D0910A6|nr:MULTISPECIES: M23 family metallopeptidase [Butyricimonas]MCB6972123.1 M23 family metallopeptidase [Butyricimonas synergistica]MCG4519314.1 M23 family metallopeptidase [Butyricimonas sp. DFI.6.44]
MFKKFFSSFSLAIVMLYLVYAFIDSPKEKQLKRKYEEVLTQYSLLSNKVEYLDNVLKDMESRDDNIYRVIFETEPIPSTIRRAGSGGVDQYEHLKHLDNSDLIIGTAKKIDELSKAIFVQSKSFDAIENLAKNKIEMLASIPAILPVSLKEAHQVSSSYGYRMHPIYKTMKFHAGMDFTGAIGTPIYATGNGLVVESQFDKGYGRHVIIDHGFSYKTMYAHMEKIVVKKGQTVKRGDVIGYLGNTGLSTGPHLHYEVRKNEKPVDPINFYFNDLSPDEFEKLVEIANNTGQSMD